LGGEKGLRQIFSGGGGGIKMILKILLQIFENTERFQKVSELAFFGLKGQNFLQKDVRHVGTCGTSETFETIEIC
jgi:hypothetical protein